MNTLCEIISPAFGKGAGWRGTARSGEFAGVLRRSKDADDRRTPIESTLRIWVVPPEATISCGAVYLTRRGTLSRFEVYLTESVYKDVLRKPIPAQILQLILHYQ